MQETWNDHCNTGMHYPEASDLMGGKTGCEPQVKIHETMQIHLNMGAEGHSYSYRIYVDDKPTDIFHNKTTQKGKVTSNFFNCGEEEFDLLNGKQGLRAWIIKQVMKEASIKE